jgi:hypothetical protein
MTAKGATDKMLSELAELRQAMAEAKVITGETPILYVNDPESKELLAPYRLSPEEIAALPGQCIEIGDPTQPEAG